MRLGSAPEMTYEEIVGTPEEVVRDAVWPEHPEPAKRLQALCLDGWHPRLVGRFFRWSDEEVRIGAEQVVSADEWMRWRNDFKRTWRLHCPDCGRETKHAAKGWIWV